MKKIYICVGILIIVLVIGIFVSNLHSNNEQTEVLIYDKGSLDINKTKENTNKSNDMKVMEGKNNIETEEISEDKKDKSNTDISANISDNHNTKTSDNTNTNIDTNITSKVNANTNIEKDTKEKINSNQKTNTVVQPVETQKDNITSKENVEIDNNNNENIVPEVPKVEDNKTEEEIIQVPKEEYKYNKEMTEKIIEIIKNNPSQDMITYGYEIIIDSSITNLTNQFTFTELRVKNQITWKFGTIRVYARDYYNNGNYMWTECFII